MKSFLVKDKKPLSKWGNLADNTFFEGEIPKGYDVAVNPSKNIIVIDVDKSETKNGFENIPEHLKDEFENTFNYSTRRNGKHYWFVYTGKLRLPNSASPLNIDLRTHKGYAIWYSDKDIKESVKFFKKTSKELNKWVENTFYYRKPSKKK